MFTVFTVFWKEGDGEFEEEDAEGKERDEEGGKDKDDEVARSRGVTTIVPLAARLIISPLKPGFT